MGLGSGLGLAAASTLGRPQRPGQGLAIGSNSGYSYGMGIASSTSNGLLVEPGPGSAMGSSLAAGLMADNSAVRNFSGVPTAQGMGVGYGAGFYTQGR